jgi:hypothetical protein
MVELLTIDAIRWTKPVHTVKNIFLLLSGWCRKSFFTPSQLQIYDAFFFHTLKLSRNIVSSCRICFDGQPAC